jgi:hypothetical protein
MKDHQRRTNAQRPAMPTRAFEYEHEYD